MSSIEMALRGSHCHLSFHQNLPLGSIFPFLGHTLSRNSTPNTAPIPAPVSASALTPFATNKLFKHFIKTYMESNQGSSQSPAECKQLFKTKVLDIDYGKLYIDGYDFCQQCKDYFKTAGATGANQTLFADSFLCKNINLH